MDYMQIALEQAEIALSNGEVPVGAVIVKNNKIIGLGHNSKESSKDATQHAEINAIKEASSNINDWRLNGCDMYVTLEPCPMCAGAIIQSRISRLFIGTFNKDMGACGSIINLTDNNNLNSFVKIIWAYNLRCSTILESFFEEKRH